MNDLGRLGAQRSRVGDLASHLVTAHETAPAHLRIGVVTEVENDPATGHHRVRTDFSGTAFLQHDAGFQPAVGDKIYAIQQGPTAVVVGLLGTTEPPPAPTTPQVALAQPARAHQAGGTITSMATPALATPATAGNRIVAAWFVDKHAGAFTSDAVGTVLADSVGDKVSMLVKTLVAAGGETSLSASWSTSGPDGAGAMIAELTPCTVGGSHLPPYSDATVQSISLGPVVATSDQALALAVIGLDSWNVSESLFTPTASGWTRNAQASAYSSPRPPVAMFTREASTASQSMSGTFSWGTYAQQAQGFMVIMEPA